MTSPSSRPAVRLDVQALHRRTILVPAVLGLLAAAAASRQGPHTAPRASLPGPGPILLHVDDDAAPGGDGSTWATAFQHLQDALAAAAALGLPGEIRVGAGTYYPDRTQVTPAGTGDRTATFQLLSGVALRGGYAGLGGGMGTLPDDRDVGLFVTVLSGDLLANGVLEDDAFSVVTGSAGDSSTELDGFTVTRGRSDLTDSDRGHRRGGGLYAGGGCATIRSCRFVANRAALGGGIYLDRACASLIENCVFEDNETLSTNGGGLYAIGTDVELRSCTFRGNTASAAGAATYFNGGTQRVSGTLYSSNECSGGSVFVFNGADSTFESCIFEDCRAVDIGITEAIGGAILVQADAVAVFRDCVLTGNTAELDGGALYCADASVTIEDSHFEGNRCANAGGGVYALRSPVVVRRTRFAGNTSDGTTADSGGGAVFVQDGEISLFDCRLYGNEAEARGGGVRVWDNGNATLVNTVLACNHTRQAGGALAAESNPNVDNAATLLDCTVFGNTADIRGFEGLLAVGSLLAVRNSVLWDNVPGDLVTSGGVVSIEHTILDGGYPGAGNLDADPQLVDPFLGADGTPCSGDEDYGLEAGSPAIDVGDDAAVPAGVTTDLDGNPRIVDGDGDSVAHVDMGALEFQPTLASHAASGRPRRERDAPRIRWSQRRGGPPLLDLHDPRAEAAVAILTFDPSSRHDSGAPPASGSLVLEAVALVGGRARIELAPDGRNDGRIDGALRALFLYPDGRARRSNVLALRVPHRTEEVSR